MELASGKPNIRRAVSGDDATVPMLGPSGNDLLGRYHLRATAHRITAECERIFGELDGPSHESWREAVGKALLASRRLQAIVDRTLDARQAEVREETRALQQDIVAALTALLALIPTEQHEELLLADARNIRDAAVGMLAAQTWRKSTPIRVRDEWNDSTPAAKPGALPRLLVVDDDEGPRRSLSRLLQRLGYEVLVAADGRGALAIAETNPLDLVITDLEMPGMKGDELLSRLKGNDVTRHIPVIVVTGHEGAETVVRCLEQGAEDYVSKPYEAVVLQARIRASLERKRMRDLELAYLRRVAQLTAAAEAVERQSYDPKLLSGLVEGSDQLGQLARVFDRMVMGIRSREQRLGHQLRQLRREIEQASSSGSQVVESPEESAVRTGDVFANRYEIRRELGQGGMGTVYLAFDRELAEEIALKVMRPGLMDRDPTLLERLKSEIRLARKISHRNVVRAHDLGEWQGVYFLTLEYIKGLTVANLLETRGSLSVSSTLAIGAQLAEALAVAHAEGIIHRDIKPLNLLVDEAGVLKVTDFGLARTAQRTGELTQTGYIVGTPRYMAPEQLLGGDVDARTDLFATGVVLYECLTGQAPFEASSPMAVVARMLGGPPAPIASLVPDVPPALSAAIDRLLQREPQQRFASARDLAEELAQISEVVR